MKPTLVGLGVDVVEKKGVRRGGEEGCATWWRRRVCVVMVIGSSVEPRMWLVDRVDVLLETGCWKKKGVHGRDYWFFSRAVEHVEGGVSMSSNHVPCSSINCAWS